MTINLNVLIKFKLEGIFFIFFILNNSLNTSIVKWDREKKIAVSLFSNILIIREKGEINLYFVKVRERQRTAERIWCTVATVLDMQMTTMQITGCLRSQKRKDITKAHPFSYITQNISKISLDLKHVRNWCNISP